MGLIDFIDDIIYAAEDFIENAQDAAEKFLDKAGPTPTPPKTKKKMFKKQ